MRGAGNGRRPTLLPIFIYKVHVHLQSVNIAVRVGGHGKPCRKRYYRIVS